MAYVLFFAYLLLLLWAITRTKLFRNSGLSKVQLAALFLIKVSAGVAYGYFYFKIGRSDTWEYHAEGLQELALLRSDPVGFFTSIAKPGYASGYGDFFGIRHSWWNNLDYRFFGKTLAFCNLFSGTNYYINSLFINLFSFTGMVLLYRVWTHVQPNARFIIKAAPFLAPSFLFWCSGIHKENVLVFATGLCVYATYFGIHQKAWTLKKWGAVAISLLLVLVLRNFLLLPLITALFAWALAAKLKHRLHPLITYTATFLLIATVFFNLRFFVPSLDFPQVVVNRQQAFNQLRSTNRLEPLMLEPTALSFAQNTPRAFFRAAFRPLPTDAKDVLSAFAAAESVMVLGILLLSLWYLPQSCLRNPFLLFCLLFTFLAMLTVGFTVIFPGAIVRYRSFILPLMLMPSLAVAQWPGKNNLSSGPINSVKLYMKG